MTDAAKTKTLLTKTLLTKEINMFDINYSSALTELAHDRATVKALELVHDVVDAVLTNNNIYFDADVLDGEIQGSGQIFDFSFFYKILEEENACLQAEVDAAIAEKLGS